jgi:hypothetical protein
MDVGGGDGSPRQCILERGLQQQQQQDEDESTRTEGVSSRPHVCTSATR